MMCFGRSSTGTTPGFASTPRLRAGSTPFSSTPVAVASPCVSIIGLMLNGAVPMTPGTLATCSMIERYSRKSVEYFSTSTCAFTPSTLSRNCFWKPPVTLMTVASAATPSATPRIANAVPSEMNARFFEPM